MNENNMGGQNPYGSPQQSNGNPAYQYPQYPANGQPYSGQGYGYQPYQIDPGASEAQNSKIFGILSLFLFPLIFAILALVKYKAYQNIGDGTHASDANVGKICAIISLALQGISILFALLYLIFVVFLGMFTIAA